MSIKSDEVMMLLPSVKVGAEPAFSWCREVGQYEDELDWMYKTTILPHFLPEIPASTQKPRDKSLQKE
jgi:hypothetical protein